MPFIFIGCKTYCFIWTYLTVQYIPVFVSLVWKIKALYSWWFTADRNYSRTRCTRRFINNLIYLHMLYLRCLQLTSHCLHRWIIYCLQNWNDVWSLLGCRTVTWAYEHVFLFHMKLHELHPVAAAIVKNRRYKELTQRDFPWSCKRCKTLFYPKLSLLAANFKGCRASGSGSGGPPLQPLIVDLGKWTGCFLMSCMKEPLVSPARVRDGAKGRKWLTLIKCIKVAARGMSVLIRGCLLGLIWRFLSPYSAILMSHISSWHFTFYQKSWLERPSPEMNHFTLITLLNSHFQKVILVVHFGVFQLP